MVPLIVLVTLINTWLSMIFVQLVNLPNLPEFSYYDKIFGFAMEELSTYKFLVGIFITFILLTKLNNVAILTDALISMLEAEIHVASKSRLISTAIVCLIFFCLGIIFLVPLGTQLVENSETGVDIASVLFLPLMASQH